VNGLQGHIQGRTAARCTMTCMSGPVERGVGDAEGRFETGYILCSVHFPAWTHSVAQRDTASQMAGWMHPVRRRHVLYAVVPDGDCVVED
jgi:hypothetical protein